MEGKYFENGAFGRSKFGPLREAIKIFLFIQLPNIILRCFPKLDWLYWFHLLFCIKIESWSTFKGNELLIFSCFFTQKSREKVAVKLLAPLPEYTKLLPCGGGRVRVVT